MWPLAALVVQGMLDARPHQPRVRALTQVVTERGEHLGRVWHPVCLHLGEDLQGKQ